MESFIKDISYCFHLNKQNICNDLFGNDDYCKNEIPKTDGLLVDLKVDMPDTTSASQLDYYINNKDEVFN